MRKVTLTFGLLSGALISGFMIFGFWLWERSGKISGNELVGYASMVIALSMVFFGIKSFRDNYQKGAIRFWKGVQVGALISLIASVMYTATWETYVHLRPTKVAAFLNEYFTCNVDKMKAKGASAAEIDQEVKKMDSMKKMYENPVFRFGLTMMEILPVGIVVSLISAGVLRKKEMLPA
jgi:hypothetical protein